jgi:hypothetical protein
MRTATGSTPAAGIGKRQIAELAMVAAADIDAFYDAQVPEPCTAATLLVLSADDKGVVRAFRKVLNTFAVTGRGGFSRSCSARTPQSPGWSWRSSSGCW